MTCIAGLIGDAGVVHLAADSYTNAGGHECSSMTQKLFRCGTMVVGLSGSFRDAQIIQHCVPGPAGCDFAEVPNYLVTNWIPSVQETLRKNGSGGLEENHEMGNALLIGLAGRLFVVTSDFSVAEYQNYFALGSGGDIACGALYALAFRNKRLLPHERLITALEAAAEHSSSVRPPFHFLSSTLPE